ncbi:MAG: DUF2207 domain-containing protein [Candidatus Zixiibacteriota bacterium]
MMRKLMLPALVLWLIVSPAAAAARSLAIEQFSAQVGVHSDGSIVVSETIRLRFTGSWNGIYRTIPIDYRTPQGFNYNLRLQGIEVTDEAGNPLKRKIGRQRHYQEIKIWVPNAVNAVRTVVVRYRVPNALRFFEDHDELYWNITGDEWEMPIESATADITLPDGASGLRALAFTGSHGSKSQDAEVTINGNRVQLRMLRPLAFREGLTAVIGWDKGVVQPPGATARIADFVRANWLLVIPVFVFPLMFRMWSKHGRDPRLRPIAVRYDPPEGLTPGEVGTLADNSPDMRDVTATLVDLATRGYVAIEEKDEPKLLGLMSGKDFSFQLLKPLREWDGLAPHEYALLDAIFDTGQLTFVPLDALKNRFYTRLPGIRDRLFSRLMDRRYYRSRPDRVKASYIAGGFLAGGIIAGVGIVLSDQWGMAPAAAVVAGALTALIIGGFGLIMPARTALGAQALEGVLGFEEFLRRVEGPRFDRKDMTPSLFEKYLPYAMALSVEHSWSSAFDGIAKQPPQWYRGAVPGGIFHPALFATRLGSMSQHTASVMTSAPRARAGRSGFGGGGFSGGGFGGGGGRGF